MSGADTTTAAAVLETTYGTTVPEMVIKKDPFFGIMETEPEDWDGDGTFKFSMENATGQGIATNYPDSEKNMSGNVYQQMSITQGTVFGSGKISGMLMRRGSKPGTKGRHAMINAFEREKLGLIRQINRALALFGMGNGGGAVGRIDPTSDITTDTITLTTPSDGYWFEIGQYLLTSANDGRTGTTRALIGSNPPKVLAVTRTATKSTVKIDSAWNAAITGVAVNDYIFWRGCHGNTAANFVPMGLDGFVPFDRSTLSTLFLGVDRSVDSDRLAGQYFDASAGNPPEEIFVDALSQADTAGANPDLILCAPSTFATVVKNLQEQKRYNSQGSERMSADYANVGYKSVKISTPFGEADVMASRGVKSDRAYALTMSSWKKRVLGELFAFLKEDGQTILRVTGEDAYAWRVGAFYNNICYSPFDQMVMKL